MLNPKNLMNQKMSGLRVTRVALLMLCTAAPCAFALAQAATPTPGQTQTEQDHHGGRHHGGMRGEMGGERHIMKMKKELNLTDDQVTRIRAIDADAHAQGKALHQNASLAEADKHSQMMALHQSSMGKVRDVLTDDQKPKFDAMVAKMQEKRMDHHKHGGHGTPATPPSM